MTWRFMFCRLCNSVKATFKKEAKCNHNQDEVGEPFPMGLMEEVKPLGKEEIVRLGLLVENLKIEIGFTMASSLPREEVKRRTENLSDILRLSQIGLHWHKKGLKQAMALKDRDDKIDREDATVEFVRGMIASEVLL